MKYSFSPGTLGSVTYKIKNKSNKFQDNLTKFRDFGGGGSANGGKFQKTEKGIR